MSRRFEVRGRGAGARSVSPEVRGHRRRRGAYSLRRQRVGIGARFQHGARLGASLRGAHREAPRRAARRGGKGGCGGTQGSHGMTEAWTIGRVVSWAADDFRRRGIESPRFEAELLLAHALKIDRMRIIIEPSRALDDGELARYRDFIRRRRAGEPVAYIRGEKEFYGRVFHIDKRVLVPRPDTEIL